MIPKAYADFASTIGGFKSPVKFTTLGEVVSEVAQKWLFPLVGLLLLAYLIAAGFDLLTSGGDPKKTQEAKEKITGALVGFLIVFGAYWLYQIALFVLGITIS